MLIILGIMLSKQVPSKEFILYTYPMGLSGN